MKPFDAFTELVNEASVAPQRQETLPYDIRAEIDWIDFSCIANPLGTPSCVKEAIASAISEGDLSFLPNSDGQHLSRVIGRYFEMSPESIMTGTSVTSLVGAIAQAYRPCNVGIPTPAPTGYFLAIANVGHHFLLLSLNQLFRAEINSKLRYWLIRVFLARACFLKRH